MHPDPATTLPVAALLALAALFQAIPAILAFPPLRAFFVRSRKSRSSSRRLPSTRTAAGRRVKDAAGTSPGATRSHAQRSEHGEDGEDEARSVLDAAD